MLCYTLNGFDGLGDNIYQRPFVKDIVSTVGAKEVYLKTPWPELYDDIKDLNFVNPNTIYRTQKRNVTRVDPKLWKPIPKLFNKRSLIEFSYGAIDLLAGSIFDTFEKSWKLNSFIFDLPDFKRFQSPHLIERSKGLKIAVIRPATVRSEWLVTSRNARPDYIAWCAQELMNRGYFVVSVADLKDHHEWMVQPAPKCHLAYYRGELNIRQLMALIQNASIVVGGVGWIVPATIAAKTPLFCILGGRGAYDNPVKITDPRMDLSKVHFARPDNFCECDLNKHDCDKSIRHLPQQFNDFMSKV